MSRPLVHISLPLPRDCRLIAAVLLAVLALAAFPAVSSAQAIPPYAWILKSGLYTVEQDETFRVIVTDVTKSPKGLDVVVRFYNEECDPLDEVEGLVLPGQPLVAEYVVSDPGRTLLRFEIDMESSDISVVPVSTVESDRPGSLTVTPRYSCAGPFVSEDSEFACVDEECPPPPTSMEFNCPELAPFRKTTG